MNHGDIIRVALALVYGGLLALNLLYINSNNIYYLVQNIICAHK